MSPYRLLRTDTGNMALELTLLVGPVLMIIGLVAVGGRLAIATDAVQSAAAEAARAASIARSAGEAQSAAAAGAAAILDSEELYCTSRAVTVDTAGFGVPVGTPADVQATVSCDVNLAALLFIPGVPITKQVTAEATSPIDTYRER